jgi:preprotein translocase subunit Sec61beta
MSVFDESMSRRTFAKSTAAVSAGVMLGVPAASAVMAQDATSVGDAGPGLPPPPEGSTVVAEGLWNPRFLAFGDDGTLYITENGIGGDEVIDNPFIGTSEVEGTPAATPVAEDAGPPPSTRGYTGQISQVTADGTQSVVVEGLVSYSDGAGPNGIALGPNEIYFAIGGISVGAGAEPLPEENTVNRYVLGADAPELIAALGVFEVENNPDGTDVNPNLYGTTYVALLSEFWPEGAPSVLSLQPDGTFAGAGGPLMFNVAVTIGPDGLVYASQLFSFTEGATEPGPGSVVRITADSVIEPVVENVMMPHGTAFDAEGNLYVAINSLVSGPGFAGGQVIRIDGVALVG